MTKAVNSSNFAERIFAYRRKKGLTQTELAARCQLCVSTICVAEKGRPISVRTRRKITLEIGDERDADWLCQRIVEQTQFAVIFADHEGIIRFWNSGAEAMFGYRDDEVLGKTMDMIVPERQRARHWEGYHRVMDTGVTKYGRELLAVPALRKDGTRISVEFSIVLLRAPTGEMLGAAAIMLDVTARWQKQKEMKERLAALEAKLEHASKSA
jgi:PAS domain S-box-containing protein